MIRAAGFIVYRRDAAGRVAYLRLRSRGHGDVGPPKGHNDPGEDDRAAAVRETREETGLAVEANPWFRAATRYRVAKGDKEVVFFLGCAPTDAAVRLSEEHVDHAWADLDETLAAIAHENLRAVFRDAATFLKDPILRRGLPPAAARALLEREVGAGAAVAAHTAQVATMARAMAEAWGGIDADYVEAAAWVHDVGRARTHDERHPLEGFRLLVAAGHPGYAPPCLSHYCKGRTQAELGGDPALMDAMWRACDLTTFPVEERLVALADGLAVRDARGTIEERHDDLVRRYGPSPFFARSRAICLELKREVEDRAGVDLYALLGIGG